MNASLNYKDIPQEERKRLTAEAYRQMPALRTLQFMAFFTAMIFSRDITDSLLPKVASSDFFLRLGVHILVAVAISGLIWEVFGRPRLKAEIVRLKNLHA